MFGRNSAKDLPQRNAGRDVSVLRLRARLAAAKTPGEAVRLRHELAVALQERGDTIAG